MENELSKVFGQMVRRLRTEAGFSQEAFAHHCDIHRTYMGDIERGGAQVSLKIAFRLSRGLKMSLGEMYTLFDKEMRAYKRAKRRAKKEAKAAASSVTQVEPSAEIAPKTHHKRPATKPKIALAGSRRQPRKPVQG